MADNDKIENDDALDSSILDGDLAPAILPDEELLEKLADELDADERTALTGVNTGATIDHTPVERTAVFASAIDDDVSETVQTAGFSRVASDAATVAEFAPQANISNQGRQAADFTNGQDNELADIGAQDELLADRDGEQDNKVADNDSAQGELFAGVNDELADAALEPGADIAGQANLGVGNGAAQSAPVADDGGAPVIAPASQAGAGGSAGPAEPVVDAGSAQAELFANNGVDADNDLDPDKDGSSFQEHLAAFSDDAQAELVIDDDEAQNIAAVDPGDHQAADEDNEDIQEDVVEADDNQDDGADRNGNGRNEAAENNAAVQSTLQAENANEVSDNDSGRGVQAEDDDPDDDSDNQAARLTDSGDDDGDDLEDDGDELEDEVDDDAGEDDSDDSQDELLAANDDDQDNDSDDELDDDDDQGDDLEDDDSDNDDADGNGNGRGREASDDDDGSGSDIAEENDNQGPIIGTNQVDNLVGTDGDDLVVAKLGDDTISAGAGDDRILAGKGDDVIEGGAGSDTMLGGLGDDRFVFSDDDFGGNWTDKVDGHGDNSRQGSGYDTIDLSDVTQGWTLELDGQDQEINADGASEYASAEDFDGTITFEDGSTIVFENIEKIDW